MVRFCYIYVGRSTLVGQRPMKSLSSVCQSICPSLRPLLSYLKIRLLVFSDILHDDSWPWYLVTDEAGFSKKGFGGPNLDPMGLNQTQNEFRSYVFLQIA